LYGATNPALTSTYGRTQKNLAAQFSCAPCLQRECSFKGPSQAQPACYDTLPPDLVWQTFTHLLQHTSADS
jgi:heptosyltransferase-1